MKKPKNKFWIDCPLCDVRMKQAKAMFKYIWYFSCPLCGTETTISRNMPEDRRHKYREEMLELRRDK